MNFTIGNKTIGLNHPTYFIAEISANHDGDLQRALGLIHSAKHAGADAAKFQHFRAAHIASAVGFKDVGPLAHQAGWKESPYEAFDRLSIPWDWTPRLAQECEKLGIDFLSTPYDVAAVAHLDKYVKAYKIGSGDINYTHMLEAVGSMGKPVLLGTGASTMNDVASAWALLYQYGVPVCIMQCNTNYTAHGDNYDNLTLSVLGEYREQFPKAVLGLSDHTTSIAPVLGAVALGARVIERHYTDDIMRAGPDHAFALEPHEFSDMVIQTRILERSLGYPTKCVMPNEKETVILQRRCARANRDLPEGHVMQEDDLIYLRPAPVGSIRPDRADIIIGRRLTRNVGANEHIRTDWLQ